MMTPPGTVSEDDPRADEPVVIKVRDNGPYKVTGPVVIVDADGNRFPVEEGRPVALCRCGASQTKPFCDRSHREVGFDACERAAEGAERS
jgi:CDGSH-type Zn-finger protein